MTKVIKMQDENDNQAGALLAVIERVASNPDADIDKLEKMLEMQQRILDRNARQAFAAAMASMQAEMPEVVERGQAHNTKYATFEDINAAVRPVLEKYGFAVTFRVKQSEVAIRITAVLSHRDGHVEETDIMLPADTSGSKNAVQAIGSTVSYGKRYTMSALLNIATRGEDDDANGAVKVKMVSPFQAKQLSALYHKADETTREWLTENYGSASNVPSTDFNWIMEKLRGADNAGA
jgi:Cys-tRNA synthase (O-phospho-L-seryl-tRNA:Cys-tRNA synthase)